MANGKPGDHPYTDIVVHGRRVYSELADDLVRRIADLFLLKVSSQAQIFHL